MYLLSNTAPALVCVSACFYLSLRHAHRMGSEMEKRKSMVYVEMGDETTPPNLPTLTSSRSSVGVAVQDVAAHERSRAQVEKAWPAYADDRSLSRLPQLFWISTKASAEELSLIHI